MRKIRTLFVRDAKNPRFVTNVVDEECHWVIEGHGFATKKIDGTACLVRGGRLYKRLEWDARKGEPPSDWLHWSYDPTQRSGHGWVLVQDRADDWMHRQAVLPSRDGTYELVGPKINGNPEGVGGYVLIPHGAEQVDAPRDFEKLAEFLRTFNGEGLVWHGGPSGEMAKIKRRDFGYAWPLERARTEAPAIAF